MNDRHTDRFLIDLAKIAAYHAIMPVIAIAGNDAKIRYLQLVIGRLYQEIGRVRRGDGEKEEENIQTKGN